MMTKKWQLYPTYKDSGVEWLGKIPEHWEVMPIKFALDIPITDGPHETPELYDEGIPFISAESIKNDRIDFDKKRGFISLEEHKRFSRKYKPQYGDVYMVKSGATTGNVARVETEEEFNIWSPLAVLRPNKDVTTTNFLFYAMKSKPFFYSVELSWSFGTQQNIGMGVISNIRIVLPPLPEQQKIAQFLDQETSKIDKLITKKERLIELLKEKRTALISHAVTKGLNPDVPMKDSGVEWLGEIPEHWKVNKFLRLAFFQEGPGLRNWQFTDDGIKVICVTNITDKGIIFDNYSKFIDQEDYCKNYKHFTVNFGDLLLSSSGNSWGKVAEYLEKETVILNTSTIRINQSSKGEYYKIFIKWILQSDAAREQLVLLMTGSCQPNFGPSHLAKLLVPVPPPS